MAHAAAAPVGGRLMTPSYLVLLGLVGIAAAILAWRFLFGIGSVTALSDAYPWGIWIAFDVVTGTAIACGGYAVAILVYALNRGQYHPLVRSAILTSALGYTIAGLSVVIDLGRYWNLYGLAAVWSWNLNSILLEVALCITLYVFVGWIELAPAFLEGGRAARNPGLRRFSERWLPRMERALPFIIALGILLPTMHQSSLGSLMLLAGPKVHALWSTPLLPLLFLITCIAMGYGGVVLESSVSSRAFGRPSEYRLLAPLGRIAAGLMGLFLVLRVGDLALRGQLGLLLAFDRFTFWFTVEMLLAVASIGVLLQPNIARSNLFRGGMLILLAGTLYRFSVFLIAYQPAPGAVYFPSVGEIMVTVGLVAAEIAAYIFIVRRFPILAALPPKPAQKVARQETPVAHATG
ncbi:MAG TPA: Ni/Fe-hydrogenase cytochrome b subunit [Longimicrobiales bacterium]|nr:Ni/Fe-hydrogenase cytochrome b subunit [Longimicrobiales bacterium]